MLLESCCGNSLRDGSLAIGIFALILNLAGAGFFTYFGIEENEPLAWVVTSICLLNCVFAVILIIGVLKEIRGMVTAWAWYMTLIAILNFIAGLCFVSVGNISVMFGTLVGSAVWGYFILVVHSLGLKIAENKPRDGMNIVLVS